MSLYNDASLVMIPSAYKDGKLYSIKPTDGSGDFTFSRSTAATRVNADGLIEKETQNLVLQSNSFDTSWGINGAGTLTSGQTGYDGSSDAWLLTKSAASTYLSQTTTLSDVNTFSVYAKAGTNTHLAFWIRNANQGKFFDLANGTIGSDYVGTPIDAKIESVGNGWYRCSVTTDDASNNCRIYPADADGDVSGTSGSIYIQDAQLEQGLVARDYIETTTSAVYGGITDNIPRLDYTDSSCPSLLLEPQRTNLATDSEYFDGWVADGVSVTANSAISPDGKQNAYLLTAVSGTQRLYQTYTTSLVDYTMSIFVKEGTSPDLQITMANVAGGPVFTFSTESFSVVSGFTTKVESFNNGWYRLSVTKTSTSTSAGFQLKIPTSGTIYIYGAQFEAGSYATSYIPTYGSAVTRNADAAYKTGVSSLIGQTEGTLFVEVDTAVLGEVFSGNSRRFLTISDGTTTNRINIYQSFSNDSISLTVTNAGATQALISSSANQSGIKKIAVGYANNDFVMYINGVEIGTDTSGSVPACNRVGVGSFETSANTANSACPVSQALLFKTRLSNAELAALTTI